MDNQKDYGKYVARRAARSPVLKNCAAAFWVGGLICLCGQLLMILYRRVGVPLYSRRGSNGCVWCAPLST